MSAPVLESGETYGALKEQHVDALARLMAQSFGMTLEAERGFLDRAGRENLRAFVSNGEVLGGLIVAPMGQYWGGRSVRMAGIAGVAVAAHARGSGVGTRMMRAAMQELRRDGWSTSTLYPATETLYRRAGYEQAGAAFDVTVTPALLPKGSRRLQVRPYAAAAHREAVHALYRRRAVSNPGYLDRGPYIWHRVESYRGEPNDGFVVEEDGKLVGYVFYRRTREGDLNDLVVVDWQAEHAEVWTRLLGFLADHGSVTRTVTWSTSESDPVLLLFPEQRCRVSVRIWSMLRLLSLESAFSERGYSPGMRGELHLDVTDDACPENSGDFVLTVADGRAELTRGGRGELQLDVGSLAAVFSGHRRASQLAQVGRIQGTPDALAFADALFEGRAPSMADAF